MHERREVVSRGTSEDSAMLGSSEAKWSNCHNLIIVALHSASEESVPVEGIEVLSTASVTGCLYCINETLVLRGWTLDWIC